jgi:hypothetical protein
MQELKEARAINLREAINGVTQQLPFILGMEASRVVAAAKSEDGWHITIELIERKAVPDTQDLIGTYEVSLDEEGELLSYERRSIRRRMDLEEIVE